MTNLPAMTPTRAEILNEISHWFDLVHDAKSERENQNRRVAR